VQTLGIEIIIPPFTVRVYFTLFSRRLPHFEVTLDDLNKIENENSTNI